MIDEKFISIETIVANLFTAHKQNNFLELDYWEWELDRHMKRIK
ncbi:hypothetical protein AB3N02_22060 [Priestia aryabhattai]